MKNIITTAALFLLPPTAFAGGHPELGGHGTGIPIDYKVIGGKTGIRDQNMTDDV